MIKWLKKEKEYRRWAAEKNKVIPIGERIEQRRLKLIEENKPLDAKAVDDAIENLWILAYSVDGNLFKYSKNLAMANALIDSYIILKAGRAANV